jgi:gluconolactonase
LAKIFDNDAPFSARGADDEAGNLYVCGPGGIWILSAKSKHLGLLRLPEYPHNLAWGDEDGRTLYITAMTSLYRIRLTIPGIRP